MKDLTAKPCNLFQKIAAPLLAVCATGVLGGQLLVYLWRGVIMPVMLIDTWARGVSEDQLWRLILNQFSLVGNAAGLTALAGDLILPLSLLALAVYALFLSKTKAGAWVLAIGMALLGGFATLHLVGAVGGLWVPFKKLAVFTLGGGWQQVLGGDPASIEVRVLEFQLRSLLDAGLGGIVTSLVYAVMGLSCAALAVCSLFGLRPKALTGVATGLTVGAVGIWLCQNTLSVASLIGSVIQNLTNHSIESTATSTPLGNAIGPILGSLCMSAFLLCVALTVLILTVGHRPVCAFARKKKAEIPAEV